MSTNAQPNIIGLPLDSVYSDIQTFLNDERFSDGTKVGYEHDIQLFFVYNNKQLNQLTHSDLQFEHKDVIKFRNFLINDKKYSNATSNRKLSSLQSLYAFFKRNKYDTKHNIDCEVFNIDRLKNKSKSYGYISPEELEAMLQLVMNQVKGYEKKMFLMLATRTSIREAALLSLTWDDITFNSEHDCYFVNTIDKNETERNQPISKQLYNDLIKIKDLEYYKRYDGKKIFNLTIKTLWSMMQTLCEQVGIDPKRKVVIHSLRNYAANFIIDTQNDLKAAQLQLGHSSIETTWKHYVKKTQNYAQSAGLLLDEEIDQSAFDKLTFEEMKQLLSQQKNGIRTQLLRDAQSIISNR